MSCVLWESSGGSAASEECSFGWSWLCWDCTEIVPRLHWDCAEITSTMPKIDFCTEIGLGSCLIFITVLPNLANLPNLPNSVKIKNLLNIYFYLISLNLYCKHFELKFEVFCAKSKHFSKIWQICLTWQIHFGKIKMFYSSLVFEGYAAWRGPVQKNIYSEVMTYQISD